MSDSSLKDFRDKVYLGFPKKNDSARTVRLVLGDQLSLDYFDRRSFDVEQDVVVMIEASAESEYVPSHVQRTVLFLSAMRHFALLLAEEGFQVYYLCLDDPDNKKTISDNLKKYLKSLNAEKLEVVEPGEWRLYEEIKKEAEDWDVEFEYMEDTHFLCTREDFEEWADGRKDMILEHFYRMMRKKHGIMVEGGKPVGGQWNFDKENRKPYSKDLPDVPELNKFSPDKLTKDVIKTVNEKLPDLPGKIDSFFWPVTRDQAKEALRGFIRQRLELFGPWQDTMVEEEPWMFHSMLSSSLNLKLLNPKECLDKVIARVDKIEALNSIEGFVRQILGWREFIRGVYWSQGPGYAERNFLGESGDLPELYWTGDTEMNCMKQCLKSVVDHGFGHHIQRLMVTGNFALISGVHPKKISDWYLGMYIDAIEWVTLPNTLGMVMHADGGIVGTKPYAAGGNYISKMSNYCKNCKYNPSEKYSDDACPFSVLYWDFMFRHKDTLSDNQRMSLILNQVNKYSDEDKKRIQSKAKKFKKEYGIIK